MKETSKSLLVGLVVVCITIAAYNVLRLHRMESKVKYLSSRIDQVIDINDKTLAVYKELSSSRISELEYTNPYMVSQMYQMLKDVHELLEQHKIKYWANAGTLLGAVRHGGIIPWDDDIDIAVDEQDIINIEALEAKLKILGYEVVKGSNGWWTKIQLINGLLDPTYHRHWNKRLRTPAIDVFPCRKKDNEYIHASSIALGAFPKEKATIESVDNRRLVNFGNFKIWITNHAEAELKYLYGNDVLTHGYWAGTHANPRSSYKWQLKSSDKLPAEPFNLTVDRVE